MPCTDDWTVSALPSAAYCIVLLNYVVLLRGENQTILPLNLVAEHFGSGLEAVAAAKKARDVLEAVSLCENLLGKCGADGFPSETAGFDSSAPPACSNGVPVACESACGETKQASCVGQITLRQHERCERLNNLCRSVVSLRQQGEPRAVPRTLPVPPPNLDLTTPRRPLTFLHIPKTAGTLIEELASSVNVSWGMNFMQGQAEMASSGPWTWTCNAYHAPPGYLKDQSAYQKAEVFCVTRHPYDRAVSEYTYLNSVSWGREELPNGSKPCTPANLNSFLRHKLGQFQRAPELKFINDCHFLPQSEYIWDEDGLQWCQHVLRLEDFPKAFNELMTESGYPMKLSKAHSKTNSYHGSCPGLSSRDLGAPTRLLLDEVYAKDFENLGYAHDVAPIRSTESTQRSSIPTIPLLHLPPLIPLPFLHKASTYIWSILPASLRSYIFSERETEKTAGAPEPPVYF